eukprot:scaffold3356_cov264-Pinguiococcus_pyrenoidosus.AAC.2
MGMSATSYAALCRAATRWVSTAVLAGVYDRICDVRDYESTAPSHALAKNYASWKSKFPCRRCCIVHSKSASKRLQLSWVIIGDLP